MSDLQKTASVKDDSRAIEFTHTRAQRRYLEAQMKKVSRSFALVVSYLEEPLKEYLSTAYLICRVVDNIEDCTEPFEWRQVRFDEFGQLLADPQRAAAVLEKWAALSWAGLTEDEKRLMSPDHGAMLWQLYAAMPPQARQAVGHWAQDMAQGMNQIEDPARSPLLLRRDGVQILASQADYNQYCLSLIHI